MRGFFSVTFLALVLLSLIAWAIQPRAAAAGKIPLVWVSDDNPARREQIALFNRLYPRYELRLDPNNTGVEKVIVQSLAGVGPDLFDCYGGSNLSSFVRSGIAWDVTDELSRIGADVKRDVWPGAFPCVIRDGRVYGFPCNVGTDGLWYNKDLFDRQGVPYPRGPSTWQQFIPLAQRMTLRNADGREEAFGLLGGWGDWPQFIAQWGGRIYTPDGRKCVVDSPQAIAAVQFMHDLIYKYEVMPSPVEAAAMATQGGWGTGDITLFGGGKGSMTLGGRWWLCTLRNSEKLRLGATEAPHGPLRVFHAYGRGTLVNRASPHREDALVFLKYLASREYNELLNHQADAVAPVVRYCTTPLFLHDPSHPEEDYNQVWLDEMRHAVPDEVSPYISGQVSDRLLNDQLDLVRADQKPVPDALHDAATQINADIRKNLKEDPTLRAAYAAASRRAGE